MHKSTIKTQNQAFHLKISKNIYIIGADLYCTAHPNEENTTYSFKQKRKKRKKQNIDSSRKDTSRQ